MGDWKTTPKTSLLLKDGYPDSHSRFFLLLLGFFSMSWAIGSIVKERDRLTAEFLFTLPYSRTSIFWAKWLAHICQVIAVAVVSAGIVLLIGNFIGMLNAPWAVTNVMLAGLLTSLAFMGIGFALSPWLNSERGALSIGIGIVSIMFLYNIIAGLNDSFMWMAKANLFNLFDAAAISGGEGLPMASVFGALGLLAAGSCAGWAGIVQRDL
ncbi:ABC transporter permease subunit [Paenibacillus sp. DMB20]|uniref:ABC transporter permease subunit n=1 Tax=Paenibacillus sp. DMB20 TaxID=1642570 RepID=UPI0009E5AF74|nr:ABC transporter permease subunit [Paenibacillus sp. DMB20]